MGTVLILAAGKRDGWNGTGRRHVLPIEGKPLLKHVLSAIGYSGHFSDQVYVVTRNQEILSFFNYFHRTYEPEDETSLLATFLSTRELWAADSRTTILQGDVIWSEKSLSTVLDCKDDLMFHLGTPAGVLALTFCPVWHDQLARAARDIIDDPRLDPPARDGRRIMGHLHRAMCGFDVMDTASPRDEPSPYHSKITGSHTRDIDTLEDYMEFLEANPWAK